MGVIDWDLESNSCSADEVDHEGYENQWIREELELGLPEKTALERKVGLANRAPVARLEATQPHEILHQTCWILSITVEHDKLRDLIAKRFATDPAKHAELTEALNKFTHSFEERSRELETMSLATTIRLAVGKSDSLQSTTPGLRTQILATAMRARYNHVISLLESGVSAEAAASALTRKLDVQSAALDTSGILVEGMTAQTRFHLERASDWYFSQWRPGASSLTEMERLRPLEIWQAASSSDKDLTVVTVTRGGQRIEGWRIEGKATDTPLKVVGIEAPDAYGDFLNKARAELFTAILRSNQPEKVKLEILRDLTQLEHRARSGDMQRTQNGGTRAEVAETYKQLHRLFAPPPPGVPQENQFAVLRQLARELGDPGDIDQGAVSDACRIATVQYRLATMRPSVVAKVVADALLERKFPCPPGTNYLLHEDCLKPSCPQAIKFPRPTGERSLASQLFQLACMNSLGTSPHFVQKHIHYTNRWGSNHNPENPLARIEPSGITRLEFRQGHEKIVNVDTEGKPVRELPPDGVARNRKLGDAHPFLVNNGMSVFVHRQQGAEQDIRANDKPGSVRKDGANHILLEANAPAYLLRILDDQNIHDHCVLAHSEMTKYTGEAGLARFRTTKELEQLVRQAKNPDKKLPGLEQFRGTLPLIIASRDYHMAAPDPSSLNTRKQDFEGILKECHNTHIMIIKDIIDTPQGPVLVTEDFFGKSHDRRFLPESEWERMFMVTRNTDRQTASRELQERADTARDVAEAVRRIQLINGKECMRHRSPAPAPQLGAYELKR